MQPWLLLTVFLLSVSSDGITAQQSQQSQQGSQQGSSSSNGMPSFTKAKYSYSTTDYNYAEALKMSLYFYECQRSGDLPEPCPVTDDPYYNKTTDCTRPSWRGDSALDDASYRGAKNKPDLVGGYYDAGDHVKFGLPMAYMLGTIALGLLEFKQGYVQAGEWKHGLDTVKWGLDYLVKAHSDEDDVSKLVVQVADPEVDHKYCCRPEEMTMSRPAFYISSRSPGTDVWGATAAALAAGAVLFSKDNKTYAEELLKHAVQIYDVAKESEKEPYSMNVKAAQQYYRSSGWADDMAYAAAMLHWATNETSYLDDAKTFLVGQGFGQGVDWDNNQWNAAYVVQKFDPSWSTASEMFTNFFNFWMSSATYTPKGLAYYQDWGSLRETSGAAFFAFLIANAPSTDEALAAKLYCWGMTQMRYILGDHGRSFVVGFGKNPPKRYHHRSSVCPDSGSCTMKGNFDSDAPNAQTLYGALVGGPNRTDYYPDDRMNYQFCEVATDYNAAFQGALAALVQRRPYWTSTCKCVLTTPDPDSCDYYWYGKSPAPNPFTTPLTVPDTKTNTSSSSSSSKSKSNSTSKSDSDSDSGSDSDSDSDSGSESEFRIQLTQLNTNLGLGSGSSSASSGSSGSSSSASSLAGAPACPANLTKASKTVIGWDQCGGTAGTCRGRQCLFDAPWEDVKCASGFECCRQTQFYYQCRPESDCPKCPGDEPEEDATGTTLPTSTSSSSGGFTSSSSSKSNSTSSTKYASATADKYVSSSDGGSSSGSGASSDSGSTSSGSGGSTSSSSGESSSGTSSASAPKYASDTAEKYISSSDSGSSSSDSDSGSSLSSGSGSSSAAPTPKYASATADKYMSSESSGSSSGSSSDSGSSSTSSSVPRPKYASATADKYASSDKESDSSSASWSVSTMEAADEPEGDAEGDFTVVKGGTADLAG